jgi:4'-phosphopantetheinyl transferase EntD
VIEKVLPGAVASSEAFDDAPDAVLIPAEVAVISRAVEKRRREFQTVRHCARRALDELGLPPAAIPPGGHREPLWPPGVVGSLTHCTGYRAAAVAHQRDVHSARLLVSGPVVAGEVLTSFDGRWLISNGLVITTIACC